MLTPPADRDLLLVECRCDGVVTYAVQGQLVDAADNLSPIFQDLEGGGLLVQL